MNSVIGNESFFSGRVFIVWMRSWGVLVYFILAMVRWDMNWCSGLKRGWRAWSISFCRSKTCLPETFIQAILGWFLKLNVPVVESLAWNSGKIIFSSGDFI